MTHGADKIAAAVLYEGYLLWPYRRSARKNQKRWTIGGVYPRAYSEADGGHDPWYMQTECLVRGTDPTVTVAVRFLQVVDRQVTRKTSDGSFECVDTLHIGSTRHLTWEEATEREIMIEDFRPARVQASRHTDIDIAAGHTREPLPDSDGQVVGALTRTWRSLSGSVEVTAVEVQQDLSKLRVKIMNTTPWTGQDRDTTLKQTLIATHTVLTVQEGAFISLMDAPEALKEAADSCQNVKAWPVLIGEAGEAQAMLSSPIILYDYPQIAPESPGDLFDGTEIDQLLVLNILALTDEEKEEMRASDPRAREILTRTESLGPSDFMRLHGGIRDIQTLHDDRLPDRLWQTLEGPTPQHIVVKDTAITKGSKVRLHPRPGGDIFDLALAGKVAVVESIEQDYDDRIHVTVTLEDDPGRDLAGVKPGHRFFFAPDEVEALEEGRPDVQR
jgi:hypothetical protein